MMTVFEKDKVIAVVLNENDKLKVMSSKEKSDSFVITFKSGLLVMNRKNYDKKKKEVK